MNPGEMNHRRGSDRLSTPVMAIKHFVVYLNSGLRHNSVRAFYGAVRSGVYVVFFFFLSSRLDLYWSHSMTFLNLTSLVM